MKVSLFGDLRRYVPKGGESHGLVKVLRYMATMFLHPGWHAVFNLRLAQLFYGIYLVPVGWILYRLNMLCFAIDIHPRVKIGSGAWLPHPFGIVVARDAQIGTNATIYQNATIGGRRNPPVLGNGVVVGAGACILGPVVLGDNVVVGANAVVTKSFPPNVVVTGVPARELPGRSSEEDLE